MAVDLDWREIAARASTIDERLSGRVVPTGEAGWQDQAQAGLRLWIDAATAGDDALFARYLRRRGLHLDTVLPVLGPVRLAPDAALPAWADTAAWMLDAIMAGGDAPPAALGETVAFADLLWPAVVAARARRGEADPDVITPAALNMLDAALLRRLSDLCGGSLFESFSFYRRAGGGPAEGVPDGTALYHGFVAALRDGPLLNLIAARPVMIRLAAVVTGQWIAGTAEFLRRLATDHDRLLVMLAAGGAAAPLGPVVELTLDISDPHDHGRQVIVLRMGNGTRLVYKPRPLMAEAAWHDLARWCAAHDAPVRLGSAPVWQRPGYGWMAYIDHDADLAADAAAGFYHNAGGLLAVMHWLRGSDLHHENLRHWQGLPVPIDLEAVLQPQLNLVADAEPLRRADQAAQRRLDGSVLAVGLLPRRRRIAGHWTEIGGLAPFTTSPVAGRRFVAINRDAMDEQTITVDQPVAGLEVRIDGTPARISDHGAAVIDGLRAMVGFLDRNRAGLLAPDGPVAGFRTARIRHVLRSTGYYHSLRAEARIPANQADGIAWSRHFERPARVARWDLGDAPGDDAGWPLLAAERAALTRDDIPLFTGTGGDDGCMADDVPVAPALLEPAVWPQLARRLDAMVADLDAQVAIARQAILGAAIPQLPPPRPWPDGPPALDLAQVRAAAFQIADLLAGQAIRADGAAAWIGAGVADDGKSLAPQVVDDTLYGGRAGIALFLAGCARLGGDGRLRDLALAALAPVRHGLRHGLRHDLHKGGPAVGDMVSIGGFAGWGGITYALTRVANLLDMPDLLDDAHHAAARITPDAIAADRSLDIVSGVAGAACGLLALYRAAGTPWVLERAVACGRHIPDRPEADQNGRGWAGVAARPLTGFSHGAAGIVHALLGLHDATGQAGFLDKARRGVDFEQALFDPACGNWPDLRLDDRQGFPAQWCHGATGIGFGRLAALPVMDDAGIRADVDAAITCTLCAADGGRDNLCCGHAGRMSMLCHAARRLGDAGLAAQADARLAAWLARAGGPAGYCLPGVDTGLRPGLMQGLAGVGQVLLERLAPDTVSPVLLLH
ncbi:type 2 lanthipeptide synthetase LanM (plasmid) [Tistrella bauzanensis]|uniref:type 2 lanthipeptide synthetase LanM n=1 Tax=Tistrella TaxID=171436 RepID=UPI0031F63879